VYVFSTLGKKIEWMRQNPKICLQVDEMASPSNWISVVINGTYLELPEPQYTVEKEGARETPCAIASMVVGSNGRTTRTN